jgi:hypothetical protein
VSFERRDCVRHQRGRVDPRVVRVDVERVAPQAIHRRLEPVGELPVARVSQRRAAHDGSMWRFLERSREGARRPRAERESRRPDDAPHQERPSRLASHAGHTLTNR